MERIKMYKALSVARYIIERCHLQEKTISNLKLQKILYFVQAEFLVSRNQPCFAEKIEAWDFGPVVPIVYQKYKIFGSANIPVVGHRITVIIPHADRILIDEIVDECAKYSASTLVDITHHQTPWIRAHNEGYNSVISNESIKEYFTEE